VPAATFQQLLTTVAGAEKGPDARNEGYLYVQWLDAQGKKQVKGFSAPQMDPCPKILDAVHAAAHRYGLPRSATPPDLAAVPKLIAQLDNENYQVRDSATRQLEDMGSLIHGLLEDALARNNVAPEAAHRLNAILSASPILMNWDPKTNIAIRIEETGATLVARLNGKVLWSKSLGSHTVTQVFIFDDERVEVMPMGWEFNIRTGEPTTYKGHPTSKPKV
jgi:hypothetical protein